jgi:hypothetical protein
MSKQRPILFSTPMVQAILEGRKTQTRRVIKPQPAVGEARYDGTSDLDMDGKLYHFLEHIEQGQPLERYYNLGQCPYGQPGDMLWVRETWALLSDEPLPTQYLYKASDKPTPGTRWKPSIHMPKEACRLFLRITNVRVERLQKISRQDAAAEGVCIENPLQRFPGYQTHRWPEENFQKLWESISGEQSWLDNPWVWVVEFEKLEGKL